MHFCIECNNMYYIRISDDNSNKLIYYCRNCGNEDHTLTVDNVNISSIQVKNEAQLNSINKYTKLDPTLPRISNVLCPDPECPTNKEGVPREIIYIRYDDVNMKYVYLCSECDTVWQTSDVA